MIIPTTQQFIDAFLANLETRLGQTTPVGDKAFNRVLATLEGMQATIAGKYAADRVKANLVITAQGTDLDMLGKEYGVSRIGAVSAVLTATLPATDGTIIPLGTQFTSQTNGLVYQVTAQVTAPYPGGTGTGVTISLACLTPGSIGNMSGTLSIQSPISGAGSIATTTGTTTTGADAELDPAYRARILDTIRTAPNGSNPASYRSWAKSVAGIVNAYPYAGAPAPATSYPGQRSIFVECLPALQADGLTPGSWTGSTSTGSGLIGQVATAIKTDPNTGLGRQDLGLVDAGLYVLPITRTPFYVQLTTLTVPGGLLAACQADLSTAITAFFLSYAPYCAGADVIANRNDTLTNLALSTAVQTVLLKYGATVNTVAFGTTYGVWLTSYTLGQGEKAKLGSITYV